MPEIVATQRDAAWFAARNGRLTASLAAACLGLDPYQSARKAWRSILGEGTTPSNRTPNRHQLWGTEHEAEARQEYECRTGNLVSVTGFWVHPVYHWLGASPDGLVGPSRLLEVKCPSTAPKKVPVHHRIQCLVQLIVTGRSACDYFAWGADGTSFLAEIGRPQVHSPSLGGLVQALGRWYLRHITFRAEPPRKTPRRKK